MSHAGFTDNAGVNTLPLPDGKSMIAMTEAAPGFFKVDLDSLATLHRVEYKDGFKGALTSAHPVVYPDGTLYNLVLDVSLLPILTGDDGHLFALRQPCSCRHLVTGRQQSLKLLDQAFASPFSTCRTRLQG